MKGFIVESSLDYFRSEIASGKSKSDLVRLMKLKGVTIIDALKATRDLYSTTLGDAKQLVSSHPAYTNVALAAEPLHEDLIRMFQQEAGRDDARMEKGVNARTKGISSE